MGRFVFTPVEVDGTLAGPAIDSLRVAAEAAAQASATLMYSGGVGSLEHLAELAALGLGALEGVIVGRALYEGRFTVAEGAAALGAADAGASLNACSGSGCSRSPRWRCWCATTRRCSSPTSGLG